MISNHQKRTIFEKKSLSMLLVGDIVKLEKDQVSPANILILTGHHLNSKLNMFLIENYLNDETLQVTEKRGI